MPARLWKIILFCIGLAATVFSCANISRPSGGDKDSEGPELIGVVPHPGARNFLGREVVFYFDEFIKPGNYSKEVFISPIPQERPEITVFNKKLTIRFREALRENTTYVITLGKEIKDFNEGNKMAEAFTYAFSTGDELDTLETGGRITGAWTGKGEDEMTVMLFDAEELEGDSIMGKLPTYVIETDKSGEFKFRYLREAKYKIYAVRDLDSDFSYSQVKEDIALAETPIIDLSDTAARKKPIVMQAFSPDNTPPVVKNVRWANDYTVHVEFGEEPRDTFGDRALRIEMQDSTGANMLPVSQFRYRDSDRKHLYFQSPHPRKQPWNVVFHNVMDTLGHSADTTFRLQAESSFKEDKDRYFESPQFLPEKSTVVLPALFHLPNFLDTNACRITDSLGKKLKITAYGLKMALRMELLEMPDPKMRYTITVDSTLSIVEGKRIDTTLRFPFTFPDPAIFGSVSGSIIADSTKPGMHYVVIITGPPGKSERKGEKPKTWSRRIAGPGSFSLDYVPAGTYTVKIIEDADQNGYLTPGSLFPYRIPEKMITEIPSIEIKGNWDLKNYKIFAIPVIKKGNKGRAAGEGKEEGEEGEEDEANPDKKAPQGKGK